MVKIAINKHLTKVTEGSYSVFLRTKDFNEITGVENIEQIQSIQNQGEIDDAKKKANEITAKLASYWGDRGKLKAKLDDYDEMYHCNSIVEVNGKQYIAKKLIEAFDLTYRMFASLVSSAAITGTQEQAEDDYTGAYINVIKNAILEIFSHEKDGEFATKFFDDKFIITNKKSPVPATNMSMYYNVPMRKNSLKYSGESVPAWSNPIMMEALDESVMSLFVREIEYVRQLFTFFYNDEEWTLLPITEDDANIILQKCREYSRKTPGQECTHIYTYVLIELIMSSILKGVNSGLIELEDAKGRRKVFRLSEITARPVVLARKQLGKYGTAKTLNFSTES